MLCKHYETSKGCAFNEKCQFAHGTQELRSVGGFTGQSQSTNTKTNVTGLDSTKKGPNPQNYKIVKCKYLEKDGTCRYGTLCTFAHGDQELRAKSDNLLIQPQMGSNYDFMGMNQNVMGSQPYMDQMSPNMMMNPFAMGFDPNMLLAMQNMMGGGYPQMVDQNSMNMSPMPTNFFMNYPNSAGTTSQNQNPGNATND